jgi:hypothetical protein
MIEIDKLLEIQKEWQAASSDGYTSIKIMAEESLIKCAEAIAVLAENLKEIGYIWAVSEQLPVEVIERNILTVEKTIGSPIPRILVMFWEKVGGVSFVDLERYQHVGFWKEQKIVSPIFFCDGLCVDSCSAEWTSSVCSDFNDWKEYSSPDETNGFLLSLSPDGYHKDNMSGGSPYGMYPGISWKPIWQNFEWSGIKRPITASESLPDFLSYLRTTILECAGFPAFFGLSAFDQIKARLLRGVQIF